MWTKAEFSFDGIAKGAAAIVVSNFRHAGIRNAPELLLPQGMRFWRDDIAISNIHPRNVKDGETYLRCILSAIWEYIVQIMRAEMPQFRVEQIQLKPQDISIIVWRTHTRLRYIKMLDPDGTAHETFRLPKQYPLGYLATARSSGDYIDPYFNWLKDALVKLIEERFFYLWEFVDTPHNNRRTWQILYLEELTLEVRNLRATISLYCDDNGLINPFIPPEEGVSGPSSAQSQEEKFAQFFSAFSSSGDEDMVLAHDFFHDFREEEWSLFCMSFCAEEEIEAREYPYDMALAWDLETARRKMAERKMLIIFYWHLACHKEDEQGEYSQHLRLLESNIAEIEDEIERCAKALSISQWY